MLLIFIYLLTSFTFLIKGIKCRDDRLIKADQRRMARRERKATDYCRRRSQFDMEVERLVTCGLSYTRYITHERSLPAHVSRPNRRKGEPVALELELELGLECVNEAYAQADCEKGDNCIGSA